MMEAYQGQAGIQGSLELEGGHLQRPDMPRDQVSILACSEDLDMHRIFAFEQFCQALGHAVDEGGQSRGAPEDPFKLIGTQVVREGNETPAGHYCHVKLDGQCGKPLGVSKEVI